MFRTSSNKGFAITFENGNTVSVQWGPENDCQKKYKAPLSAPMKTDCWKSSDAEVAAWDAEGNWHHFDRYMVTETLSAGEVAEFIAFVSENTLTTKQEAACTTN